MTGHIPCFHSKTGDKFFERESAKGEHIIAHPFDCDTKHLIERAFKRIAQVCEKNFVVQSLLWARVA